MGLVEVFYFIWGIDKFNIDVVHFPMGTKESVPVESILTWGVLPLGVKRRTRFFTQKQVLNFGALETSRRGIHLELKRLAKRALGLDYGGYRLYRISPEKFLEVMSTVYGKNKEEILAKASPEVLLKLNDHPKE